LEQDLTWQIWGTSPLARSRTGPSWSWAYGSDNLIVWAAPFTTNNYKLLGIVDRLECDGNSNPMLSLKGSLLAVSLQTWTEMTKLEQSYCLTRSCRVIQHEDMQYTFRYHQTDSADLQYPPLAGASEPYDSDEEEDSPYKALRGHFNADFKFWSSEEDLQHQLQRLIFFAFGVEVSDDPPEELRPHWVVGMILRPVHEGNDRSTEDVVEQFERIGWLRYCTENSSKDFVPAGTETNFLLV
jgi:hypothetical protein